MKKMLYIIEILAGALCIIGMIYGAAYAIAKYVDNIADARIMQALHSKKINNLENVINDLQVDIMVLQHLRDKNHGIK